MDRRENTVHLLQCNCCVRVCRGAHVIAIQSLPSNGRYLQSHYLATAVVWLLILRSLPSNGSCRNAPSLRIFVPNSLQAYYHFFYSEGCACDVCDRPRLPSPWLGSHGDESSTPPAAPSLRPLVPSRSLMRCEPVQVYHHQPRSMAPLGPVYHFIYPVDHLVWPLP
jgi:hypothetical protein